MKLFVHLSICLFVYLSFFSSSVFASGEFSTSFRTTYLVTPDAKTTVTHQIVLTNQRANTFASEYSLTAGSTTVGNIRVFDNKGELPFVSVESENSTSITVKLGERPVVGIGSTNTFTIQYQDRDIASLVGKVLEVNIPKISNAGEFSQYETHLTVPESFGSLTTVSPHPSLMEKTVSGYHLTFRDNVDTGISAVFGSSQRFRLNLTYYLENKGIGKKIGAITLVPDTPYQRVRYGAIDPKPVSMSRDPSGNWIATYRLAGREKLTITVTAEAEIFMVPTVPVPRENPTEFLSPTQFWPSDDPQMVDLGKQLKTPQAIYDYVVSHLSYDYSKIELGTNRLGGRAALSSPTKAICTEFTDLFITLARAAGIPARELNGYAYTQNPKLRPLSLKQDILHAWPEYFDERISQWIPVDPTWGNTTGGIDYFNKLDFNHIVFAIHGISPTTPLSAGFFKSKDDQGKTVFVEPSSVDGSIPAPENLSLIVKGPSLIPSFFESFATVTLVNNGQQALYGIPIRVNPPPDTVVSELPNTIPFLLPGQQTDLGFIIKPSPSWKIRKERISITIGDKQANYDVIITPPIISYQVGAIVLAMAVIILAVVAARARHLHLRGQK